MSLTIGPISPFFVVRDLQCSLGFYTKRLGFSVIHLEPADDPFFAIVERGAVRLLLKFISSDVEPLPNVQLHEWAPWDAFVYAESPEVLVAESGDSGVSPAPEVVVRDDGLIGFEVTDPDGYVLFFGKPHDAAG